MDEPPIPQTKDPAVEAPQPESQLPTMVHEPVLPPQVTEHDPAPAKLLSPPERAAEPVKPECSVPVPVQSLPPSPVATEAGTPASANAIVEKLEAKSVPVVHETQRPVILSMGEPPIPQAIVQMPPAREPKQQEPELLPMPHTVKSPPSPVQGGILPSSPTPPKMDQADYPLVINGTTPVVLPGRRLADQKGRQSEQGASESTTQDYPIIISPQSLNLVPSH